MQGNVVTAAKWLGASLVLASVILIGGLHWVLSLQVGRLTESLRPRREATITVSPPAPGVEKLLAESEKLRLTGDDWERFWLLDKPSHPMPDPTPDGGTPQAVPPNEEIRRPRSSGR